MSHSFSVNRVQVVFSTKRRQRQIPPDVQPKLWAYMAGIATNRRIEIEAIGGTDDHVHLVLTLPPVLTLAKAIQEIKAISSKWMRETGHTDFAWQEGYAAFSIGQSQLEAVVQYVKTQEEHHRKHGFEAEFLSLLAKHRVAYDPKYVFG